MTAYATKTSMVRALRAKGQDIPSSRGVVFQRHISKSWYTMTWRDSEDKFHWADYSSDNRKAPVRCTTIRQRPGSQKTTEHLVSITQPVNFCKGVSP